jgi:hypothetical protein
MTSKKLMKANTINNIDPANRKLGNGIVTLIPVNQYTGKFQVENSAPLFHDSTINRTK